MLVLLAGRATWLLPAVLLLFNTSALAQRQADAPPTHDPFGQPPAAVREVPGGRYASHSLQGRILTVVATDGSHRQVQSWAPGVVKISYFAPGRLPLADSSASVVQAAEASQPSSSFLSATATSLRLRLPDGLTVVIQKESLRMSLLRGKTPLLREASAAFSRRAITAATATTAAIPPSRIDELAGTGVRFALVPGERLYGTGARALPLDRRGYRLALYNQAHYGYQNDEQNLNVTLPVVRSSRGYLLLFDHYAAGYLDLGHQRPDALEYGVEGLNSLSYFIVTGRNEAEILNHYTRLTGRQPLPPRWALGLIQSRFGYRSQAEVLAVAERMHRADFPLDGLVLDLYWFGGTTRQGDFAWDAAHFPDPAGMMRTLRARGVHTLLISEPYVMRTSRNDSLVRTQALVGTTAAGRPYTVGSFWAGPASILDVFKPQTRTWLWTQYQRLHDQGVAGWWSDLGEPENHPEAMHHQLGPTRQVHNAYGHRWAQLFQDNYQRTYPDERLFNLARSGWAGMQRNSVFPWSGDVNRSWSGLQAQVAIMVGMGQAGVGYMHSDAGGFGANAVQDPELYTRWLQLAALCPIMRPHSDEVVPPEPYTYPEPYQGIVRRYAHLRYELLPYLYTLAAQNTLTGAPLTRALDYDPSWPPTDSAAVPSSFTESAAPPSDQYLLGPHLLVAPVSQPGQRRRNVVLPATPGGWVDFTSGQSLSGGQTVGLPAALGQVPLLARAGAFVPMTAYRSSTAAYRPDTLRVRYFPDPQVPTSEFEVYEDDGHSAQALAQHQYTLIKFAGKYFEDQVIISASLTGTYPGAPTARLVQLCLVRVATAPTTVRQVDGQLLPSTAWQFNADRHELRLQFTLTQQTSINVLGLRLLTQPATQLDPDALTLTAPDSRTSAQAITLHYVRYAPATVPELLCIRDARGQVVRTFATDSAVGTHALTWDGRDAQGRLSLPGVYAAELQGQHQRLVRLP